MGLLLDNAQTVHPPDTTPDENAALAWRDFPNHALPVGIRGFVSVSSVSMGCDPSAIALPLLVSAAAAIGNSRRLVLKDGWDEPAILWAAYVGDSGSLKSPAIELATTPLRRAQEQAFKDHADLLELYEQEKADHERELAQWNRNKVGEQPTPPDEPTCRRYLCSDITVEAMATTLVENPRGLMMHRDELSGWVGGFNQYKAGKGGDAAHWLEMFGGRSMMVDRKSSGKRNIYVPRAAVSIIGGIQPDILRRLLGREHFENGLAARLLMTMPPRQKRRWTDNRISPVEIDRLCGVFGKLLQLNPDTHDGTDEPVYVRMSDDAKSVWVGFYNTHGEELESMTGDLAAAWSKLEAYAARLSLVIHYLRWAESDHPERFEEVDADSVRSAVELVEWFKHETRRIYCTLQESEQERETRLAIQRITTNGGSVTVRQWQRMRSHTTAESAERELDALASDGVGRWDHSIPSPKGGRPTKRFVVSSASDTDKTPSGDQLRRVSA